MYISADLLENLFLRLPFKSLGRFKTVCKEWNSLLESKRFVEMRLTLKKSGKILTAYDCPCDVSPHLVPKTRFLADQELICLHYDATKPSLSYDGLVCVPEAECVEVLNPSTGQLWRFPSPSLLNPRPNRSFPNETWSTYFPGYCAMGFGRDSVEGHYKVVRMFIDPNYSDILDVNTGEWKKLCKPPCFEADVGRISACVNGIIYWLRIISNDEVDNYRILALDLHTEVFHHVQRPPLLEGILDEAQIVDIGDRLAIAMLEPSTIQGWDLDIWTMSSEEETWRKTHSISSASLDIQWSISFTPVTLSKEGNVVFYDNTNRLFKYYQERDELNLLSTDIHVISPYVEKFVPIRTKQVELRTGKSGIICPRKGWLQLRADGFLTKGICTWLWRKKIEMLVICMLVCLSTLIAVCWTTGSCYSKLAYIVYVIKTMIVMKFYGILNKFLEFDVASLGSVAFYFIDLERTIYCTQSMLVTDPYCKLVLEYHRRRL